MANLGLNEFETEGFLTQFLKENDWTQVTLVYNFKDYNLEQTRTADASKQ
jgi:hypothetical protein